MDNFHPKSLGQFPISLMSSMHAGAYSFELNKEPPESSACLCITVWCQF